MKIFIKQLLVLLFVVSFIPDIAISQGLSLSEISSRQSSKSVANSDYNICRIQKKNTGLSSYESVFIGESTRALFNSWLGVGSYTFKYQGSGEGHSSIRNAPLKMFSQVYSKNGKNVEVVTYLPCPKNVEEAKVGLLGVYARLDSRLADIQESVMVHNDNYKATLIEYNKEECSLLIKFPKEIRIYLNASCKDKGLLFELANELSLERLETKINN